MNWKRSPIILSNYKYPSHSVVGWMGILMFTIYLALAYKYRYERMVMPDSAFQIFHSILNQDFAIQENRFGSILTHVWAYFGGQLRLTLEQIMGLTSMGLVIIYAATFALLVFHFQNLRLSIGFFFFIFGITTHSFFWSYCEMMPAACIMSIGLAYFEDRIREISNQKLHISLAILLLILGVQTYPLMIVTIVCYLLWILPDQKIRTKQFIGILIVVLVILFIVKKEHLSGYYDHAQYRSSENLIRYFPNYFGSKSLQNLCVQNGKYIGTFLLFLPVIFYYLRSRQWIRLAVLILFGVGYIIAIGALHYAGAVPFYVELQYGLACFVLGWGAAEVLSMKTLVLMITLLVSYFGCRVVDASTIYQQRIVFYEFALKKYGDKILIRETPAIEEKLIMVWSAPYETWLLSTARSGQSASILISDQEVHIANKSKDVLLTVFNSYEYKAMDTFYFHFNNFSSYRQIHF